MKKLNILLLSALALGITTTSCTKSDPATSSGSAILGKWIIDSTTQTNSTGTSAVKPYNDPSCTDKNFWNFKAGNIINEQTVGEDSANPCGTKSYDGTYTFINNKLHYIEGSFVADYTVVSITSSQMIVRNINPNDATQYITYTLTK